MKKNKVNSTLSLYDNFRLGDRVKRVYKGQKGIVEYEGIIMSIDHDKIEVYWDKIDGLYCPECIDEEFSICDYDEVLKGNKSFSPIKCKKNYRFI